MKRSKALLVLAFSTLTSFMPFISMISPVSAHAQRISAAECVMEVDSRRILYQEHGDIRLPMASTTKIATAISVLDSGIDIEATVSIPHNAVGVEGSSVYLKEGEEYSVKDLLYGLMLRSGNDCAVALAETVDGSVGAFSTRMNETAERAGALNTHFVNPHGLPAKLHYTTAVDLSLITSYAMQNPLFCSIVSTKYYQPRAWQNKNKMLVQYEGAIGVKTGYTKEAGKCLVSAAEREGMRLVVTVLNCPTAYERSKTLFDDAFSKYTRKRLLGATEVLRFDGGEGVPGQDYYYPLMEGEEEHIEIVAKPFVCSENKKIVGQFEIYLLKQLLFCGNLYKL
jgi:D-alanyl-D-alanine carboxypeptidase